MNKKYTLYELEKMYTDNKRIWWLEILHTILRFLIAIFIIACLFGGPILAFFLLIKSLFLCEILSGIWTFIALFLVKDINKTDNKMFKYIEKLSYFKDFNHDYSENQYYLKTKIRRLKYGNESDIEERIMKNFRKY